MTAIFDSIPNLSANISRGLAAVEKVLRDKTSVHRAMYREGLGWVDFVWGDEGKPPNAKGRRKGGKGISHAIEARQRKDGLNHSQVVAMLHRMVMAIAEGVEIKPRLEYGAVIRVVVGKDGTEANLVKRTGANGWVLTVFKQWDEVEGGALDAANEAIQPTSNQPTLSRPVIVAPSLVSGDFDPSLGQATHPDSFKRGCPVGADDSKTLDSINLPVNSSDALIHIENAAHEGAFGNNPLSSPTDAQCIAGNYKVGRVDISGFKIAIEQPRGTYRTGIDVKTGKRWVTRLAGHYGYFSGTKGADGDPVDVFIGFYPYSEAAFVINQFVDRRFDEHKVMLCYPDEETARKAYIDSYERGWKGLQNIIPATLEQLRWWLKYGDTSRPLRPEFLPYAGLETMTQKTYWDGDAMPVETTLDRVLYDIRRSPGGGLVLDAISMMDIVEDADGLTIFDALVTPYAALERKMNVLKNVMDRSGQTVKVTAMQISDPFTQRGVANVAVILELSDGQTVTIFLHNPDVTPRNIMPTDELISWKWLLNKKDITIVVAPEKGHDLDVKEVARRIMRLAEKNSTAFGRANVKRAERMQSIEDIKTEIVGLESELKRNLLELEVAKLEAEDRRQNPQIAGAPETPEINQQNDDNNGKSTNETEEAAAPEAQEVTVGAAIELPQQLKDDTARLTDAPSELSDQKIPDVKQPKDEIEKLKQFSENIEEHQVSSPSPLDAFESAGREPWQVTQAKWVEIMTGHFAAIGQPANDSDISDFKGFHESQVKAALDAGKPIPEEALADYPGMRAETEEEKAASRAEAERNLNRIIGIAAGETDADDTTIMPVPDVPIIELTSEGALDPLVIEMATAEIADASQSTEEAANTKADQQDIVLLHSVVDGTVADILSPELGEQMAAAFERNQDDPAFMELFNRAVNAYTAAMMAATA